MKSNVLTKLTLAILLVFMAFGVTAQIETTSGTIEHGYLQIYFGEWNEKTHSSTAAIDFGSNIYPEIVDENGRDVYFESPVDLIIYMSDHGFYYEGTETFITKEPREEWWTVRIFTR